MKNLHVVALFCAFFLRRMCTPDLEDDLCFHTILKSTFLGGYYEFFTAFLWLGTFHDSTLQKITLRECNYCGTQEIYRIHLAQYMKFK